MKPLRQALFPIVFGAALWCGWCGGHAAIAATADQGAQTIVHMLDYVSVDYPEFVRDGKAINQSEYDEQKEFVTQSVALLGQLPARPGTPALLDKARSLLMMQCLTAAIVVGGVMISRRKALAASPAQ